MQQAVIISDCILYVYTIIPTLPLEDCRVQNSFLYYCSVWMNVPVFIWDQRRKIMQRINDGSPYLNEGAISQQSFRPADLVFSVQQDARGS